MLVKGVGKKGSKIVLVGEAPGKEEEAQGVPFVGGAGRVLNSMLAQAGIDRDKCYVTNVMKIRPEGNDFSKFYLGKNIPSQQLLQAWDDLKKEIIEVDPNVVVALGNEALIALTGLNGIFNWRGSVLWEKSVGCKVVPTVHPALVMRMYSYAPLMLFDLKKARVESAFKDYRVVMPNLRVINSLVDALRELDMLKSPVAFDIECNEGVLTAIGFATSPMDGFSIVMDRFTFESRVVIMEKVKEILESPLPKIAQNAQFDILWLEHYLGIKVNNLILDTMCAHHTVYSEIPKGLETLTSIYTDFPYYKHWVHSNLGKYNAMDACATFKVYQSLMKEMEEFGVKEFYYKFVHPLLEPLMEMQLRGVRVDLKRREEMTENVGIEIRAKEVLLEQKLGFYVNVNSPKQLRTVLYDVLKMPKKFSRTTGKETVDEDALTELAKKYSSDVLELILDIRKLHKVKGTYLEAPLGEDGRMHTSYVIGGTETGRLASRRSLFGSGTNLQNVPKGACRSIFIPDEGKVFVEADLSQAEARIVAWESKDLRLIDIFVKGEDIHTKVASWIFDVKEVDVNEEQRQLAKKMVHAMNYGMGVRSLARWLGVSLGEATVLMEKYQRTFPAIEEWHKKIVNQLRHNRMLITPLGRKRLFFNRWGEDLFREAYAFIPQSTVADLLNLILVRTYKRMKIGGMDAQMVLQVHDSFVVQAKEEDVEKIKEIVNESNDIRFGDIVIPMKFKVGTTWDL